MEKDIVRLVHRNDCGCILFSELEVKDNTDAINKKINEMILPYFQVGDTITLEEF